MPIVGGGVGLSAAEAERRLGAHGSNVLPAAPKMPVWRRVVEQFVHFFALMLWAAGVLAIVGGLPVLGVAIFVVIVVNGVFAFVQEYRAEQAAERLGDLLPRTVMVVRDGHRRAVDAEMVVVGDLVVLAEGDRVCADMICVDAHGLLVDTSTLTGESVPDSIGEGGVLRAGTFVVGGEGAATVTATGPDTELARIAVLTQRLERPDTPLTRELHRLVRTIAVLAVTVGAVFFVLMLLIGTGASDGFVFAIGITVALVPEALLPTVTLSLAIGAQRMAEQQALVRRLESVETLGSTTVICTDKTGTLTQNRMRVVEIWTPDGAAHRGGAGYEPAGPIQADTDEVTVSLAELALAARTCSNGRVTRTDEGQWVAQGDPMEAAIDSLARQVWPADKLDVAAGSIVARFPFDPHRRRSSVITADGVVVKGAPDAVLGQCDPASVAAAETALTGLSSRGLRVLAVAVRSLEGTAPRTAGEAETDLVLLGLLGFQDPPRPEAAEALAACRAAGIQVAMITGDHPQTARSVADQVGLRVDSAPVLVGADLPDDDQLLGALVDRDGVVVARVDPETKLRIARVLRQRGHIVAMTGDGVNDGPALREADIGIAMGASGSDVAREAADLVLLDDNFATIVAAISQGRATFENARRFLTYHLTDNVAELTPFAIWAVSGGRFPLALGVLQILALDIGTDTLSATALGAEPAGRQVMSQPPISGRLLNRTVAVRSFAVLGPTEAAFEMACFLAAMAATGWRPGDGFPTGTALAAASGAAFLSVVVAQSANAFACRSTRRPAWKIDWTRNRFLLAAVLVELGFALAVLAIAPAADLLDHGWPPALVWVLILASAPAVLAADGLWKRSVANRTPDPASRS